MRGAVSASNDAQITVQQLYRLHRQRLRRLVARRVRDAAYRLHRQRLRRLVARRVRDAAAVDDIVQDVFVKLQTRLATLHSPGSVAAWLDRVTANAIADHYRGLRSFDALPDDLAAAEPQRDVHAELAGCLAPIIDDLPPPYRDALRLSELEALPQREVALRLGLSLPGAKSRVQRGRALLKERLLACYEIEVEGGDVVGCTSRDRSCRC